MLLDFQRALADLAASAPLCMQVRGDTRVLQQRYRLTEFEFTRLVDIVHHDGMACACTVQRAHRLAALAMNFPLTCKAPVLPLGLLDRDSRAVYPEGKVNRLVEAPALPVDEPLRLAPRPSGVPGPFPLV